MTGRLIGWEIRQTGKVYCIDCDCFPPGANSILSDDAELELYQCDGCGRMFDNIEPLDIEPMGA